MLQNKPKIDSAGGVLFKHQADWVLRHKGEIELFPILGCIAEIGGVVYDNYSRTPKVTVALPVLNQVFFAGTPSVLRLATTTAPRPQTSP